MPEKRTAEKAKRALREGKAPTTAAGEFVREEIEHVRQGKHGARSPEQAIAIGLSKARRAGVPLPPPEKGRAKARTRKSAKRDYEVGQGSRKPRSTSKKRARRSLEALEREPRDTASRTALSKQAKTATRRRRSSSTPRRGEGAASDRAKRRTTRSRTGRSTSRSRTSRSRATDGR
jgi:hypothetical protein